MIKPVLCTIMTCFIYFTINPEGAALCLTWPSESGPRAKIIAHPWCTGMGLSPYGIIT